VEINSTPTRFTAIVKNLSRLRNGFTQGVVGQGARPMKTEIFHSRRQGSLALPKSLDKTTVGQGCPTYEKTMIYLLVARALPPFTGSAYGMTSSGEGIFRAI